MAKIEYFFDPSFTDIAAMDDRAELKSDVSPPDQMLAPTFKQITFLQSEYERKAFVLTREDLRAIDNAMDSIDFYLMSGEEIKERYYDQKYCV